MASTNGDANCSPNPLPIAPRETVTVFWDYENCPCPMSTKLAALTLDIKRRIDHFLGRKLNKRIQLYCPMQRLQARTRENATDLGILMMDVASKRKQESVDKRIIADIGLFAAELAETGGCEVGHIVLVSGDSDYGYILARLRDKAYIDQIILFHNDVTPDRLTQHADFKHELFRSNLSRKENPFSDLNQSKIPGQGQSHFTHSHNHNHRGRGNHSNRPYQSHHSVASSYYSSPNSYGQPQPQRHGQLQQQQQPFSLGGGHPHYAPPYSVVPTPVDDDNRDTPTQSKGNENGADTVAKGHSMYRRKEVPNNKKGSKGKGKGKSHGSAVIMSQEKLEAQLKLSQKQRKQKQSIAAKSKPTPTLKPKPKQPNVNVRGSSSSNSLSSAFFDACIAPNTEEMEQMLREMQPKHNSLLCAKQPMTDHSKQHSLVVELSTSTTNASSSSSSSKPRRLLLKKRKLKQQKNSKNSKATNSEVISAVDSAKGSMSASKREQLRLVWDALSLCQSQGNNTPRRSELVSAMRLKGRARSHSFGDECIDACLAVGTVEQLMAGRISALYILPVILNALTAEDCPFSLKNTHWVSMEALKRQLTARHRGHLATYFTLTYLFRVVSGATRLFAFHKEDRHRIQVQNREQLTEAQLRSIRFRLRNCK